MIPVLEQRAATVLFNALISRKDKRPFLLPANVCPVVPLTFMKACQPFEFVDISMDTLCIDEVEVLRRLGSSDYAGVLFVRTYGVAASFERFFAKIKGVSEELFIIDDRCLSVPIFDKIETIADLILFSTGYAKMVDIGFGGYGLLQPGLAYQRQELAYSPKDLEDIENDCKRDISAKRAYVYKDSAWLDTALPDVSLNHYSGMVSRSIESTLAHKKMLNDLYAGSLPNEIQLPDPYQWWRFNIYVPRRNDLIKRIFAEGLFASTHYPSLGGIMGEGCFPIAEKLHGNIINLFNDRYMEAGRASRLVRVIIDAI